MRSRAMTIVDLMAIPLAVAAEIAAIQAMNDWQYQDWWFTIVQIPFFTILVGIYIKIGLQLWRKRECSPFLLGFAWIGPLAIILVHLVLLEFQSVDAFHQFMVGWLWNLSGPEARARIQNMPSFQSVLKIASCAVLVLAQCLIATVGGWVARRLRLTVVRKPLMNRFPPDPELVTSASAFESPRN